MNPMKEIKIEKVTLNIGCGEAGQKLEIAKKLLEMLTKRKIVVTHTYKRTTFGMAKGRPIGVKVTLRGKDADAFLKNALEAIENKLLVRMFDKQGNFSFGIKEYIDLPGVRYDPEMGMIGMDVCVTLERKGFCVTRKRMPSKISKTHRITPDDAREWAVKNYGVKVE